MKTIIETATSEPTFTTLVTALKAAGLVDILSGEGPFTVLAPTNAAFAKIPEATLAALLADKVKLSSVLTYHVISGTITAKDMTTMTEAKSVEGTALKISTGNETMINNAKVTRADIECSNGIIHGIDTVLMP